MDRAQADALISELASQLNLPDLALDSMGACSIAVNDGATLVHIGHDTSGRTLNFMICLDDIVPAGAQLFDLLSANFDGVLGGGGYFSVEPSTGALVLQRRIAADSLQGRAMLDVLEAMVNAAEYWSTKLADAPESGIDAPAEAGISSFHMELRA